MSGFADATWPDDVARLTVLITGANGGIGLATARWFAVRGARVILLARTPAKARAAAQAIGGGNVLWFGADYTRFAEVRQAAADILRESGGLDIVINNAGRLMRNPNDMTEDGYPAGLQVNYLSHFLLTACLVDRLLSATQPRVINVVSKLHRTARGLRLERLTIEPRTAVRAFAEAKALMVAFTAELNRRFGADGLVARSVHPGIARSNVPAAGANLLLKLAGLLMIDAAAAAQNIVRTALFPSHNPQTIYFNRAKPGRPLPICLDRTFGSDLWRYSLKATAAPSSHACRPEQ